MQNLADYVATELDARQEILEACPIDVYTSSVNPRWAWPWKLEASNNARPGIRPSCESLIIDPGVRNYACTEEVANAAWRTDADYILARDISHEHPLADVLDGRDERHLRSVETVVNTVWAFEKQREVDSWRLGRWECAHDAGVIVPIQPPYDVSLAYMARDFERPEIYVDDDGTPYNRTDSTVTINLLEDFDHFAIGGLLGFDDVQERIEHLHYVRDRLGPDAWIHALAPGTDPAMIRALREHPGLVDSLDVSTPENAVKNGKIPDKTWKQHKHQFPRGIDSSTIRGAFSAAIALQLAYMLGPRCDDPILDELEAEAEAQAWG